MFSTLLYTLTLASSVSKWYAEFKVFLHSAGILTFDSLKRKEKKPSQVLANAHKPSLKLLFDIFLRYFPPPN